MPALTTYSANKLLGLTFAGGSFTPPAAVYLAAMTSPPGADGGGTEVVDGSYARQALSFAAAAGGECAIDTTVGWAPVAAADQMLCGWAIFDALTSGNMLALHVFPTTSLVRAGQPLTFDAGRIVIAAGGTNVSDTLANAWLEHLLRNNAYTPPTVDLRLYTTAPTRSTNGTEVPGSGGYTPATGLGWTVTGTTVALADPGVWSPLDTGADRDLTAWAATDGTDPLIFAAYPTSQTVGTGDDLTLPAGAAAVTIA